MSATKALECCKQPPYTDFASRDAVAKPRLDGTPTPRSLGGSDDEAAGTNRCSKSASEREARQLE